ncbi:hypothetical protein GX553_03105 [Candidatus Peribacteria bacterium]|nr:hypothetical protein [Candidatus Peribacteria bacterium]
MATNVLSALRGCPELPYNRPLPLHGANAVQEYIDGLKADVGAYVRRKADALPPDVLQMVRNRIFAVLSDGSMELNGLLLESRQAGEHVACYRSIYSLQRRFAYEECGHHESYGTLQGSGGLHSPDGRQDAEDLACQCVAAVRVGGMIERMIRGAEQAYDAAHAWLQHRAPEMAKEPVWPHPLERAQDFRDAMEQHIAPLEQYRAKPFADFYRLLNDCRQDIVRALLHKRDARGHALDWRGAWARTRADCNTMHAIFQVQKLQKAAEQFASMQAGGTVGEHPAASMQVTCLYPERSGYSRKTITQRLRAVHARIVAPCGNADAHQEDKGISL